MKLEILQNRHVMNFLLKYKLGEIRLLVKHPKYQAMDNAREYAIPRVFEEYASAEYQLKRIEPYIPDEPRPGPIPRPTFEVYNNDGVMVAQFYPNGYADCKHDAFKPIYDRMVKEIEEAAQRGLKEFMEQEKLHRKIEPK